MSISNDESNQNSETPVLLFTKFVELHQNQLVNSGVPELYWHTLYHKLVVLEESYDAGTKFQMQQVLHTNDNGDTTGFHWSICATSPLQLNDPQHIYLIDHAWTYSSTDAYAALKEVPGLVQRMTGLMDIQENGQSQEELIDIILDTMWQYNQTYRFGNFAMGSDDALPRWYIMDEFGSRIRHSDDPNFRVVPFFFSGTGLAYSIMWPIKDTETGDEATRDYLEGEINPAVRQAKLIPWQPVDLSDLSYSQKEPGVEHFASYRLNETLPSSDFEFPGLPKDRNVKVFIEYREFIEHLTDPRFEVVESPDQADVLWYFRHFHEFLELSQTKPGCLINQFPCENVVTVKDMMAIVARRAATPDADDPLASNPKWLPVTYNLKTELAKFVSFYQHREKRDLDNHWICKPWNLARSLDTYVTKNLKQIVRLPDSGPKVACKYIENPVLFYRSDVQAQVKFDIRYIVLLTSVEPLQIYAYQVFWLRFANMPYSLTSLYDYEKHFTVMNYVEGADTKLKQVHYNEFIPEFERQYPEFQWQDVENDIFRMFKELFQAATALPAPQGIGQSPQSRAMYAVDLMLAWDKKPTGEKVIQPMICEVNFSPDCARACKYHPFFVNDIFSVLFLDDTEDKHVVPL
ncbi:unnamed protein product [Lymnaea stagnalis]|uniref:Tubulin--tyrosine ligase-like protein 12 SET-like domain-containing protein n=1 Tax=Lymnaea stagnalis TaxID=6523 RepID=A0AAV2HDF7_LYMST